MTPALCIQVQLLREEVAHLKVRDEELSRRLERGVAWFCGALGCAVAVVLGARALAAVQQVREVNERRLAHQVVEPREARAARVRGGLGRVRARPVRGAAGGLVDDAFGAA